MSVAVNGPTRLPLGAWRSYTVADSGFLADGRCWLSWTVFADGTRPGVDFHRQLEVGNEVSVRIGFPEPAIERLLAKCASERFELLLVGDASAIGLFSSLARRYQDDMCTSLIADRDLSDVASIFYDSEVVRSQTGLLDRLTVLVKERQNPCLVVVGEKSFVGEVRSHVRQLGVAADRIAARVYWTPGKIGPE
jgi:NADPH-dependent ferric siderophore reductase